MSTNRLGRGLGALFQEHDIESLESFEQVKEGEVIHQLEVKSLRPNPYQPRKYFDENKIKELAMSIKEHGVFQPIIVKKILKVILLLQGSADLELLKKRDYQLFQQSFVSLMII